MPAAGNVCTASTDHLFVTDKYSRRWFLVDTGSDLSVYPRKYLQHHRPRTNYELYAADGSTIHTYGWLPLSLNLGLRRDFTWRFVIADVTSPLIGADFLTHYGAQRVKRAGKWTWRPERVVRGSGCGGDATGGAAGGAVEGGGETVGPLSGGVGVVVEGLWGGVGLASVTPMWRVTLTRVRHASRIATKLLSRTSRYSWAALADVPVTEKHCGWALHNWIWTVRTWVSRPMSWRHSSRKGICLYPWCSG
jgi:hypothetical protein